MVRVVPPSRQLAPAPRSARVLTATYALATVTAAGLLLVGRHRGPTLPELLLRPGQRPRRPHLPLGRRPGPRHPGPPRAASGSGSGSSWRSRRVGIYLGLLALLPARHIGVAVLWRTHGGLGRAIDVAGIAIGSSPWSCCARARACVPGSARPRLVDPRRARRPRRDRPDRRHRVAPARRAGRLRVAGRRPRRRRRGHPRWGRRTVARPGSPRPSCSSPRPWPRGRSSSRPCCSSGRPDRSTGGRPTARSPCGALLARHGRRDSLGYFATRRDKASVFSPDGRAAVTYRVLGGVSLASADPVGSPDALAGGDRRVALRGPRVRLAAGGGLGERGRGPRATPPPGCACSGWGTRPSCAPNASS